MDGRRMDSRGRMASDQIAHPEFCSGELKHNKSEKKNHDGGRFYSYSFKFILRSQAHDRL